MRKGAASGTLLLALTATLGALAPSAAQTTGTPPGGGAQAAASAELKPIPLVLPKPAFKGTPEHAPPGANLEPPRKGPRPPFMAPPGVALISKGRKAAASDQDPIIGEVGLVNNGDKEARDGAYVEFGPGVQWVQLDLEKPQQVFAVVVWHYHNAARIYHDVIVQLADDPDFTQNVRTIYSNDHDNSSGLGVGPEKEYWETYEGRLMDGKGQSARYVRLYSNGSTADDQNHYTEIEVFGAAGK